MKNKPRKFIKLDQDREKNRQKKKLAKKCIGCTNNITGWCNLLKEWCSIALKRCTN